MTVTLARFVWADYQDIPTPAGPSVAVGRVGFDQAGVDVTLHLYGLTIDDVWDVASWARLAEGTVQPFDVDGEPALSRWWVIDKITFDSWDVKANGQATLRLELGVVRDGGLPVVESLIHGQARRRTFLAVPAANAVPWHAVPQVASTWYTVARAAGTLTGVTFPTASGASVRRYTSSTADDFYQGASAQQPALAAYPLAAGKAMDAAAKIEVFVGGVWRTVHGMELPAGVSPSQVRVSNGLGRVTGGASVGSRHGVTHEVFDGAVWSASTQVTVADGPVAYCSVRRNSAAACMVAFTAADGWQLTVLLRRGAFLPVMTQTVPTPTILGVDVWGRTGFISGLTNGATAPSGAGHNIVIAWVLGEDQAMSAPSNMRWGLQAPLTTSATTASFTGGILPTSLTPQTEIDLWHAQQSERILVPR